MHPQHSQDIHTPSIPAPDILLSPEQPPSGCIAFFQLTKEGEKTEKYFSVLPPLQTIDSTSLYEDFLSQEAANVFPAEEKQKFLDRLSFPAVSRSMAGNLLEYRRVDAYGAIAWTTVCLSFPDPEHIQLLFYTTDQSKKLELSLLEHPSRDRDTNFYSQDGFFTMADRALHQNKTASNTFFLLLIDAASAGRGSFPLLVQNTVLWFGAPILSGITQEEGLAFLFCETPESADCFHTRSRQFVPLPDKSLVWSICAVSNAGADAILLTRLARQAAKQFSSGQGSPVWLICPYDSQRLSCAPPNNNAYDELTGLLSHSSYLTYLSHTNGETLSSLGVLSLDINGLKHYNRDFGYHCGDLLIKKAAEILKASFQTETIFRFAGDEFLVLCPDLTYAAFASRLTQAEKNLEEAAPGLVTLGYVWEKSNIDIDRLAAQADERMRMEKQKYYLNSQEISKYHLPMARDALQNALKTNAFAVYFQPKVDIRAGKIIGAEALVRYHHPEYGIVMPNKFIPMLEKSRMIHYLDLFVFEQVCGQLRSWLDLGLVPLPLSLNFSRATLLMEGLWDHIDAIRKKYGIEPGFIEIELTETLGDMDIKTIIQVAEGLKQKHYLLSLDDFGSDYSSLSILSAMDFDILKLDKSLISSISFNKKSRILAESALHLCKKMKMQSVAEGVETQEQLQILKKLGCDVAQGYLFDKPLPAKRFAEKYLYLLKQT